MYSLILISIVYEYSIYVLFVQKNFKDYFRKILKKCLNPCENMVALKEKMMLKMLKV